MSKQTLRLDELVDPFEARVVVANTDGAVSARFDMAGLPRLDAVLLGQPVAQVPDLVKRLCGICPVTHHLAGVRALEAFLGYPEVPPSAQAVRELLHFGSMLDAIAPKFFEVDRAAALTLRRFGKQVLAAAGAPGHFPSVAVPGGVRALAEPALVSELAGAVSAALAVATSLAELVRGDPWTDEFTGANLALARPLSGEAVVVSGAERSTFAASDWPNWVVETHPGSAAPRPILRTGQSYRVGPVARLIAVDLAGQRAAVQQKAWVSAGGGHRWASAIMMIEALEEIDRLLLDPRLVAGDCRAEPSVAAAQVGVGWVDGPRGLLVHCYSADDDGRLAACQILTPTAQNEPWLAEMLSRALARGEVELEQAVRTADPCLPCVSAPTGKMGLVLADKE